MADNVLFESGDNLDESNLLGAHAKTNQTDYVVRGLGFAADHTAETLDTGSGAAIIETSGNEAYILETIDARSGLAFATTTGTNYVFLSVDDTTDANDISITIKSTDTPPSDPSLKIGEVDASADTSTELNRAPSITAEQIGNARHYAGAYDGADADARLSNALADAKGSDTIYLESATYTSNITVSDSYTLIGTARNAGTQIDTGTTWTFSGLGTTVQTIDNRGTIVMNGDRSVLSNIKNASGLIEVGGIIVILAQISGGNVTFLSGTGNCIIDSSADVTVTDNGTGNTVGDIA